MYNKFRLKLKLFSAKILDKITKKPKYIKVATKEIFQKYSELRQKKEVIQTIALGSSHAALSFHPESFATNSFNLGSTSQDLYYSFELYKYCVENLPNLKNIILFYSVFSPGLQLQKIADWQYCCNYKLFYNIDYQSEDVRNLEKYYKYAKDFSRLLPPEKLDSWGYYLSNNSNISVNFDVNSVKAHLRENKRNNNQTKYVEKLSEMAQSNGHNLVLVISPVRSDYQKFLPDENELFPELIALKEKCNFELISYQNLQYSDFRDCHHLNEIGAKKFTSEILKLAQSILY